ncbi:phosphoribosylglycinamide formyltransferase [Prosthecomicrobium sp. N25]|uniref:phosphoribosylglycinamide formyltransferase n=1 Tax=Prosthecomicrobium sp. N25 TaxID=3129254 RepID=UPI003077420B
MVRRRRVGIAISGGGSNMAALVAAARAADYPAEVALVVSNRPDAGGLAKAAAAGVPTAVVDHKAFGDRQAFEIALHAEMVRHDVELVCLAGFMRLLTPWFIESWMDRMINIHPSLLPAFPGLHTHARALAEGVKLAGCTVHFVRHAMDTGPVVGQAAVPVLSADTPETLAARVLAAEHRLYPRCLALVASGRAAVVREGGTERVAIAAEPPPPEAFVWPSRD